VSRQHNIIGQYRLGTFWRCATPSAHKIVLVMDNLNTHPEVSESFYEAFPPEAPHRLLDRLEFHYTPKHGSWLNMAEIELSVLARQCLDRRILDKPALTREVAAWQRERNTGQGQGRLAFYNCKCHG